MTRNVCIVNMIFFLSAATRKHAAAREVFQKIPPDSIDVIHKQWELTVGLYLIAAYCYQVLNCSYSSPREHLNKS